MTTGKRVFFGALIAESGAFVWCFGWLAWFVRREHDWLGALFGAGYGVLITCWFVLPMGGVLGVVMPALVRGCSPTGALVRGALLGICAGIFAAFFTTVLFHWRSLAGSSAQLRGLFVESSHFGVSMIPFCMLWVSVWACRWRRIAEPCASANAG